MRTDLRVLRPKDAAAKVGLSRMHLYRLEKSDRFPKRIHLGEASVGWLEHEIDSWLAERIALRDAAEPARSSVGSENGSGGEQGTRRAARARSAQPSGRKGTRR